MTLLEAFEQGAIPHAGWTHREHLAVSVALLEAGPVETAIDRFRAGVQALNAAHGVVQTDTAGYHETLTRAFIYMIAAHLRGRPDGLASVQEAFADKYVILRHYTRERVMSRQARYGWVLPDLAPIPGVPFLRPYQPGDRPALVAAVAALHDELRAFEPGLHPGAQMAEAYTSDLLATCEAREGAVLLATVDDTPIGFAAMRLERAYEGLWNATGDVAYLSDMRVDSAWRGRGVGKALLERVEALARERGAAQLRLMVMSGAEATRAAYRSAGFSDLRVIMQKPLGVGRGTP
jgi:GNAT superfamily N-acetyltransferase